MRRSIKNKSYSLRAFAQYLDLDHSTLSALLRGKRKMTKKTVIRLSSVLNLDSELVQKFLANESLENKNDSSISHFIIQNDLYSLISEWYYDAILEMAMIKDIKFTPDTIASLLDINITQASFALETLERLELLVRDGLRYKVQHLHTSNILDANTSTIGQKKYQVSILEKSIKAVKSIDPKERNHTSTTIAINHADLPKVKVLIKKFSRELAATLQHDNFKPDKVYQLQIGFFPLMHNSTEAKT